MRRSVFIASALVLSLVSGLILGLPPVAVAAAEAGLSSDRSVPVKPVEGRPRVPSQTDSAAGPRSERNVPPRAGSARVVTSGSVVNVGGLPVSVTGVVAPDDDVLSDARVRAGVVPGGPAEVLVSTADPKVAVAAGVRGVVLSVTPAQRMPAAALLRLRVSYAQFANMYGANFGQRLRLVALPVCALTTPELKQCQTQTPLATENANNEVVGEFRLPAGETSSVAVLAVTSTASSEAGAFTETSLSPTYSWASGGQGGSFSWSYPLKVPASLGGPAPDLALGYDSGSVDGMTLAQNGQTSWVGEGWDLQVGFIERSYRSCAKDGGSTGDLCWFSPYNATMVFGGRSHKLIRDGASQVWKTDDDNGLRIEQFFNPSLGNGDNDGEYWRVTTLDGTQYHFGKHKRYVGETTPTNSLQLVPVYGNHPGEPCYNPTFANAICDQGYRWNLDYVVDARGNSMTYFYRKFTGRYGTNNNSWTVPYDVSATLDHIDYGTRAGSETSSPAPMQVWFELADRCHAPCSDRSFFPDTPWDLHCVSSSCPHLTSPAFWSPHRVAAINTVVRAATGENRPVDRWNLTHDYPEPGDGSNANLWLRSITHLGYSEAVQALAEPTITFGGIRLPNRVDHSFNGIPAYNHYRLDSIENGVGGQTRVFYSQPDCPTRKFKALPLFNPYRCFPQFVKPATRNPGWAWFHRYVVTAVTETDLTNASPDETWSYQYGVDSSTDPSLWAHDGSETSLLVDRSWPVWRGYTDVTTTHGPAGGTQTVSKTLYHRGMHGDSMWTWNRSHMEWGGRHAYLSVPLSNAGQSGRIGGLGGMCLDAIGAGTANGTGVQLYDCTGAANQVWLYTYSNEPDIFQFVNPASGRCLDVAGSGSADGTKIQLWDCHGGGAQRWRFHSDGTLRNLGSSKCLDVKAWGTANGTPVELYQCTGTSNQIWRHRADGSLVNTQQARCMEVAGGGSADGTPVQSRSCLTNVGAQHWAYWPSGSSLQNPQSGKCLDVSSFGTANGTLVRLWTCNNSVAQIWVPQANGSLKNPNSGRCLDASTVPHELRQLQLWDCDGSIGQRWSHQIKDEVGLAGRPREEFTIDNGQVIGSTIHNYSVTQTGLRPKPEPDGQDLTALMARENSTMTRTWIQASNSWRWTEQRSQYDFYGQLLGAWDRGDVTTGDDDTCTEVYYNRNPGLHLIDVRREVWVTACGAPSDANILSVTRHYYDNNNSDLNAAPTQGLLTRTEVAAKVLGGQWTWKQASRSVYDSYGRPTAMFDALERQTTTTYTPATGAPVTSVATTGPMGAGWTVTTTIDPGHGVPKTVTDANGKVTTGQYDALGRLVKVWRNNRPTNSTPDAQYTYTLASPSWVRSDALGPNGNQISSYKILDGRLRPRQTQTPTQDGKRTIGDVQYDGRGLEIKKSIFYNSESAPASQLKGIVSDADVESQTRYVYDRLERKTHEQLFKNNAMQWQAETRYEGDRTGVIPPSGGTATQDVFDANGRVIEKRQFSGAPFSGAFAATTYAYDRVDRLVGVKDPANNQWAYEYDLRGRKTKTVDPDAGTSTSTYDDAGQVLSTTDARGQTLHFDYDSLGRKTKEHDATPTGTVLAEWVYDTVDKGQLAESIRRVGSDAYKTRVTDLDDGYRPLHTEVEIPNPAVNGALAATYAWDNAYKPNGAPATTVLPGVGGLPAETLATTYDNNGFSLTLSGTWAGGGAQTYIASTAYTFDGLASATVLGNAGKQVKLINEYQVHSRRLSAQHVDVETTPGTLARKFSSDYGYDPAGNITSVAGKSDGVADQTECFRYDHLRRLTEAWTQPTFGTGCSTPQRTGADPYWRQWTFDTTGNRLTQTDRDPTAGNTTWTYTVGSAGGVKPHQVKTVTATGSKADAPVRTFGYDPAGNTTSAVTTTGVAQTLSWDKESHLATVTEPAGTHSYVYDADGRRLIARTPTATTLYLPDGTELELPSAGGAALGKRYYGGTAVRDAAGVKWTCSNHQGTSLVQIDSVTLTTNRRRSMPYGEDRTTTPAGWVGTKGYVGGTKDTTTYTHLGAREYDPTLGRFISVDPIMDLADPRQWNAYTYANNSPITFSDPTGLKPMFDDLADQKAWQTAGGNKFPGNKSTSSKCTGNMQSASCRGGGGGGIAITVVGNHTIIAPSEDELKAALDASWQATRHKLDHYGCTADMMTSGGDCAYSVAYYWHGDALCGAHPGWCTFTRNRYRPEQYYGGGGVWTILLGITVPPAIALGLTSIEGDENFAPNDDAIFEFALDLSEKLGEPVTSWHGWEERGKPWLTVDAAVEPDSNVQIHFNLDGIRDAEAWAETGKELTAVELRAIRDAPKSVQARVTWYLYGQPTKSPFAK